MSDAEKAQDVKSPKRIRDERWVDGTLAVGIGLALGPDVVAGELMLPEHWDSLVQGAGVALIVRGILMHVALRRDGEL